MTTRAAAAALVVALLLAACGDEDSTSTATTTGVDPPAPETSEMTTSTTTEPIDPMFVQLCGVLNAALGGEVDVARMAFDHGPLHTLADAVIDIDRGVAARLLEAKEAVESRLAAPAPNPTLLVTDLEMLTAATADALVATGTPMSPTCDQETP